MYPRGSVRASTGTVWINCLLSPGPGRCGHLNHALLPIDVDSLIRAGSINEYFFNYTLNDLYTSQS